MNNPWAIAKYYEDKYYETLQRLHMAKRRAREDKVKLRNAIASYRESHEELRKVIEMHEDKQSN